MPLIRINATDDGLTLHRSNKPASQSLGAVRATDGPAIVMIHGYKYHPGSSLHCPHAKIFGSKPSDWPRRLGFLGQKADEGLAVALGWNARGPVQQMHRRARSLGKRIAELVALLRASAPLRPVHVIAHSMGSELALSALDHLQQRAISRMVLLTGASHQRHAAAMLNMPAGRDVEVLNITSRENDLFDAAFERFVPSAAAADGSIGRGIDAANVATLQLDCVQTLKNLKDLGFAIATTEKRVCHWSSYTRSGTMSLYQSFLRSPDTLPLSLVGQACPEYAEPRWSRLLPRHALSRFAETGGFPQTLRALGSFVERAKTAA